MFKLEKTHFVLTIILVDIQTKDTTVFIPNVEFMFKMDLLSKKKRKKEKLCYFFF